MAFDFGSGSGGGGSGTQFPDLSSSSHSASASGATGNTSGLFGGAAAPFAQQQQQQQQQQQSQAQNTLTRYSGAEPSAQSTEPPLPHALQTVLDALNESSPTHPFVHYFYNLARDSGGAAPAPGSGITATAAPSSSSSAPAPSPPLPPRPPPPLDALWDNAVRNNPDAQRYAVTPVVGFSGLHARVSQQRERVDAYLNALGDAEKQLGRARLTHEQRVRAKLQQVRRVHAEVERRMIEAVGRLESALSDTASLRGAHHASLVVVRHDAAREAHLRQRLDALRRSLVTPQRGGRAMVPRVDAVRDAVAAAAASDDGDGWRWSERDGDARGDDDARREHDAVTNGGRGRARDSAERGRAIGSGRIDGGGGGSGGSGAGSINRGHGARAQPVDAHAAYALREALQRERDGIEKLLDVLERDARDARTLRTGLAANLAEPTASR